MCCTRKDAKMLVCMHKPDSSAWDYHHYSVKLRMHLKVCQLPSVLLNHMCNSYTYLPTYLPTYLSIYLSIY